MKIKIYIVFSAIIILFLLLILYVLKNRSKDFIEVYGNIEIRTVDLSFQISGVIKDIFVEEGDYVKKGDLLATVDNRDYIAKYKKSIFQTKALAAQKSEDLSKYKRNYSLCVDDTVSKQECTTLLNSKNASLARYKESLANLQLQKNQLDYTILYAPQDGIITTRSQEKGARVEVNQTVFIMSLTEPIWVRSYISEKDLGNIKYGTKADIITDTVDKKTKQKKIYNGYVGYISPIAEFTPKTVQTQDLRVDLVYRIRVYVNNPDEYLRLGMPVTVRLKTNDEICSRDN